MAESYLVVTLVVLPVLAAGLIIGLVYRHKQRQKKTEANKGASV